MSIVAWVGSIAAIAAGLFVENRFFARGREPTRRESILWSLGWIAVAIVAAVAIHMLEDVVHIGDLVTLAVIFGALVLGIVASGLADPAYSSAGERRRRAGPAELPNVAPPTPPDSATSPRDEVSGATARGRPGRSPRTHHCPWRRICL